MKRLHWNNLAAALAVCSICVICACQQDGGTSSDSKTSQAAAPKDDNTSSKTAQAQPEPTPPAVAQPKPAAQPEPEPEPDVKTASTPPQKPEWEEQKPLVIEDEASKRAQAENMIYATIRIKMEDMIEKRAELLKSGRPPSDVEIRQLEGSIMRARDLLQEAGEIVEDVEPPIVQVNPR